MKRLLSCLLCIFRKVKKSESKSQLVCNLHDDRNSCVYSVKLKNLKANHNLQTLIICKLQVVYIP